MFQTTADITHADRLVSCTDGVSDNLLADELMNIVRAAADADDACIQVSALVNQHIEQGRDIRFRGGRFRHDDETAIFRFFWRRLALRHCRPRRRIVVGRPKRLTRGVQP